MREYKISELCNTFFNALLESRYCIVAGLILAFNITQTYCYGALNRDMAELLQVSAVGLETLMSLYLIGLTAALLPAGILYNRIEAKRLLLIACALTIVSAFIFWIASSFWLHGFNRILSGVINAFIFVGGLKLIADYYTKNTAVAIGVFVAMGNCLGGWLVFTPYIYLKTETSYHVVLGANFLLSIILFFMFWLVMKKLPQTTLLKPVQSFTQEFQSIFQSLKIAFTSKIIWICGIISGVFFLSDTIFSGMWGIFYLTNKFSISELAAGNVMNAYVLGIGIGCPLIGLLAQMKGRLKLYMVSGIILCGSLFAIILFSPTLSYFSLNIIFGAFGFAASVQIISYLVVQKHVPENYRTAGLSVVLIIMNLSNTITAPIFGLCLNQYWDGVTFQKGAPLYSVSNIESGLQWFLVAYVVAVVLALMLKIQRKSKFQVPVHQKQYQGIHQ